VGGGVRPLAIDLFAGLGGWTSGLMAEGWDVIGFDIERHIYPDDHGGEMKYPAQLVLQDVLTIHGSQFRNADLIVASPPCQAYSYMAMPWSKAKAKRKWYLEDPERIKSLNALFDACFRIQAEASAAAGRHIPMVVENVRGAQEWVGRAKGRYGSFYFWGDVPPLMPDSRSDGVKVPSFRFDGSGRSFQSASVAVSGRRADVGKGARFTSRDCDGIKQPGPSGAAWFDHGAAAVSSRPDSRKRASAMIAKIPLPVSRHIAQAYRP